MTNDSTDLPGASSAEAPRRITLTERRDFVRRWIERAMRRATGRDAALGGTVGSVALVLPLLAEAQIGESVVAVGDIANVSNVTMLSDGSARLTLSNGREVVIPAEELRIEPDGTLVISEEAATFVVNVAGLDPLADAPVADTGGGGGGGGDFGGGALLGAGAVVAGGAGVAFALGGGGGDGGTTVPLNLAGALGGDLSNESAGFDAPAETARIRVQIDPGNGDDPVSFDATLGADGVWQLILDEGQAAGLPQGARDAVITALDGADGELGTEEITLQIDTIPPVIAFDEDIAGDNILNIDEQDTGITVTGTTDAEPGQTVTVTIDGQEFTGTVQQGGIWSVDLPDTALDGLDDDSEITLTAEVTDAAGNPSDPAEASFDTDFTPPEITIDTPLAGNGVINLEEQGDGFTLSGTAPGANLGDTVTVLLNGTVLGTTTVEDEAWSFRVDGASLSGLTDGDTPQFAAQISDGAGNVGEATEIADTDLLAPEIAITDVSVGEVMNIEERTQDLTISGTATGADGQEVTVNITGTNFTTTVTGTTWTLTVPNANLPAFSDATTVPITADVSDANDNPAETAEASFTTDFIAPTITITNTGTGEDGVLSIAERGAGITISGTTDAEDGQTVTVRLFDDGTLVPGGGSDFYVADVDVNGDWSVEISPDTLAQFSGDGTIRVTANVDDRAGNPATEAEETFARDLTPPTISFDDISGDNQIGLLDVQGDLEITGTTNAEVGQEVTLTFNGQEFTGSVISNSLGGAEPNAWSVTVPQSAIEAIQTEADTGDGTLSDIPVTATVSDAAGNPATVPAETTIDADFNGPSIAIDPITGDNVINVDESGSNVTITGGTNNVPQGQTVTVTVGDTDPPVVLTDTVDESGAWSVTLTPSEATAAGLTDGATVTVSADVSDGETDAPTAQVDLSADFTPPSIEIDTPLASDGVLSIAERDGGFTVTGSSDAEDDQVVTVTVNGQQFTGTVQGGTWSVDVGAAALTGLADDANIDITADVSDAAGNPATQATASFDTDFTAPTIAITTPIAGDDILNIVESGAPLTISGTSTGADGEEVTVNVGGTELTATVQTGGAWSVTLDDPSTLPDGQPIDVTADVSDAAGNPATQATASFDTDFTPPTVTIDTPIAGDDVLNIAERDGGFQITGTATGAEGQQVTVTLDDFAAGSAVATGTVDGGVWTVNFTQEQGNQFLSGQQVFVRAVVSDTAGNEGSSGGITDFSFLTDFTPPAIAITTPIATDDIVNIAERDGGISISGTSDAIGQEVTVTFNGTALAPVVVDGSGNWTVDVPSGLLTGLSTSDPTPIIAEVTDTAGNTASDTASVDADFSAPTISIGELAIGDVMNAVEQGENLVISGNAAGMNGEDLTVTFNGTALAPVTVTGAGTWTVTIQADDPLITGLTDSQTVEITATGSDAAENPGNIATASFTTDFDPPIIEIDPLSIGAVFDLDEREAGADLTVTGSTDAPEGASVTVTLNGTELTNSPVLVNSGEFSVVIPAADLAALADETDFDLVASVDDAAGNTGTSAPVTFTTDFKPEVDIDPLGDEGALIIDELDPDNTQITGTTRGVENGQLVAVTVLVNGSEVDSGTAEVTDGVWSFDVANSAVSALEAGDEVSVTADVENAAMRAADQATEGAIGHDPAAFFLVDIGRTGADAELALFGVADELPGGLSNASITLTSSPGDITEFPDPDPNTPEVEAESQQSGIFVLNADDPANATVGVIAIPAIANFDDPLVSYIATLGDTASPLAVTVGSDQSDGVAQSLIGTDSADTLTAPDTDSVLQGRGGDDTLDASGAGVNLLAFEADATANGTDTVTGFSLGADSALADVIGFVGLDFATLRGAGTDAQALTAGGALGTDTGFVVLESELGGTSAVDLDAAAEGLTGLNDGDEFFLLAGDGTDAALARVTMNGSDATVEVMANFEGIGDLSGVTGDNILGFDTAGV